MGKDTVKISVQRDNSGCATVNSTETLLFATKTCPNCRVAESMLRKANVIFRKVYAEDEPDLAEKMGISHAPTLVINGEKIINTSNIRKYIEEM